MPFRGIEWFNPDNFSERGRTLQRRFGYSFLGFMAVVLLAVVITAVTL